MPWDYTYDSLGRLESATRNGVLAESYVYDQQGNRLEETNILRGVSRSYTNDIEDKVVYAGADSYSFDVDGFLTERNIESGANSGITTFDYSSRGELLSATLPDATVISYDHDPMGRRITKRINGVITEKYLWQNATTLLAVLDPSGNLLQRFEYADGRMPVSMVYNGAVYYPAYDQVGSLRAIFDNAGNMVKQVDYDSFGNILSDSNPIFTVPLGFAGGLNDRDTGLVRFGARDYDPTTGKWTAKDSIDFAGGDLNLFSYTGQDPVNWVDPEGMQPAYFPDDFWDEPSVLNIDIGFTGGIGKAGINIGLVISDQSIYGYYGIGVGGGAGASITLSPNPPSAGISAGGTLRGGTGVVGAYGSLGGSYNTGEFSGDIGGGWGIGAGFALTATHTFGYSFEEGWSWGIPNPCP